MDIENGVLKKVYDSEITNGTIVIPENVTSIGKEAFRDCRSLESIEIPEGVTRIGEAAFTWCTNLTNIKIPESVTSIEKDAFLDCQNLTSIKIPEGITSIEEGTFSSCNNLTSINIPESVTSIKNYAFSGCFSLESIEIPQGVTSIESGTFSACISLKKIKIPEGVKLIENYAFSRCSSLTSIEIPESVTSVEDYTFSGCSNLKEIKIPEGVTSIGNCAFEGCRSLKKIKIPEGVTRIEKNAFEDCRNLESIEIPESVTSIEQEAFLECRRLTSIEIPQSVTSIKYRAFSECSSLSSINIPESVTSIEEHAFSGCSRLMSIEVPESVTSVEDYTFSRCSNLKEIKIPEGVTSIGNYAFEGCSSLESINIPESVISINSSAFDKCSSLTEIELLGNVLQKEQLLFQLYHEYGDKIDKQLMFGKDIKKFERIKSEAHFSISNDYDEKFMNELYHKIIYSVGIDELEKMVKVPQSFSPEKYKEALKNKEEIYRQLYEEKHVLSGDFGTVAKILKEFSKNIDAEKISETRSSVAEKNVLAEINNLLNNPEIKLDSLEELTKKAIENAGYEYLPDFESKIQKLQKTLNKKQFQRNIDQARDTLIEALSSSDTTYGPQLAQLQIEPIANIIEDKLRKIYMQNSKVSVVDLREQLINELANTGHAIYISNNAQNIADRFINLMNTNDDFNRIINYNTINIFQSMKEQIGENWDESIRQVFNATCKGQEIKSIPDEFSKEQIETLKEKLGIEIETEQISKLKKGVDREKVYELIESIQGEQPEEIQLMVTYKQLHDMFGGVSYPYSEEFKKYFKLHREEFLKNPKYIVEFTRICNDFDSLIKTPELKNIYNNGNLEIDDILGYLGNLTFKNEREGDEKLAKLAKSIGKITTEEQFTEVQNVFDIVKRRERTSIPPMYIHNRNSKFRGRMLSPNDVITMFAGNITDCCQRFGDCGMGAMLLGTIEENAGIFVVEELQEDGNYQIIGQSLTFRQKGKDGNNDRLTFDNIEITKNVKARLTKDDEQEVLNIYQDAGKQAIEIDKKFLGKLLKSGKITQKDYDNLVIKEVIAGRGYNDLSVLDTLQEAETIVPDEAYYQYRSKVWGTKMPWIDSTESGAPTGSNNYSPVIIATMQDDEKEKIDSRRLNSSQDRTNLSDVPLWYGKVDEVQEYDNQKIREEQIELIKKIERNVYRQSQQLMNNEKIENYKQMSNVYELEDVSTLIGSGQNWYMIYGIGSNGECKIQDLALEGGVNSNKNDNSNGKQKYSKLAVVEMADAVYGVMIQNAKEGKKIVCNATKDTSLINIRNMAKKGIAEIYDSEGKKITVSDENKLVYEDGEEVSYRNFEHQSENEEEIQMLDLEIKPNIERMIEEKKKTEEYLQLSRKKERMEGMEKEEAIDNERRTIRDDLSR